MKPSDIEHLKETMDLRFDAHKTALDIQTKETERRLDLLNGEAERLKIMQSTYLPREVYQVNYRELTDKIESLQKMSYIGIGIVLTLQVILKIL